MYAIKDKKDNTYFCGWHEYVQLGAMDIERWNDVFPYWTGHGFPMEEYETIEGAEEALKTLDYTGYDLEIVKV